MIKVYNGLLQKKNHTKEESCFLFEIIYSPKNESLGFVCIIKLHLLSIICQIKRQYIYIYNTVDDNFQKQTVFFHRQMKS